MADISIEQIKKLKELSGVGLTDAKKALVEADGDFDKALDAMRKKLKSVVIAKLAKVSLIPTSTMAASALSSKLTAKLHS